MKRTPMTLRGAEALRAELKRLKSEERPRVIKAIAEARGHGDLSENAEYHAAREQQGFIEGRITEIERKLANAEVIDAAHAPRRPAGWCSARPSSSRTRTDGARVIYQIVGEDEADIRAGPHLDHLADRARAGRQGARRGGGRRGPGRHALLRDRDGPVQVAPWGGLRRRAGGSAAAPGWRGTGRRRCRCAARARCGARGERREERLTRRAVAARRLDLDELMVGERALGLAGHARR